MINSASIKQYKVQTANQSPLDSNINQEVPSVTFPTQSNDCQLISEPIISTIPSSRQSTYQPLEIKQIEDAFSRRAHKRFISPGPIYNAKYTYLSTNQQKLNLPQHTDRKLKYYIVDKCSPGPIYDTRSQYKEHLNLSQQAPRWEPTHPLSLQSQANNVRYEKNSRTDPNYNKLIIFQRQLLSQNKIQEQNGPGPSSYTPKYDIVQRQSRQSSFGAHTRHGFKFNKHQNSVGPTTYTLNNTYDALSTNKSPRNIKMAQTDRYSLTWLE